MKFISSNQITDIKKILCFSYNWKHKGISVFPNLFQPLNLSVFTNFKL